MAKIARVWDGSEWVELSSSVVNYPAQAGNANKYLRTDGSIVFWDTVEVNADQIFYQANAPTYPETGDVWVDSDDNFQEYDALNINDLIPSQSNNSGKFLMTDGYNPSWESVNNSWSTISTPSGTNPIADDTYDVLNFTASNGMVVTGNASTDTVNFSTNATSLNTASTIISRDADQAFDITAVDFDTVDTIASAAARLNWNSGEGTLVLGLKGGNIGLPIGQEEVALCYNATGSTLTKGTVVYVSGAQGQRPALLKSSASSESTSSKTFGVVSENIAFAAEGFVTTFGIVRNINTSSFTAGQALWLSTTAGEIVATPPTQPNHSVFIGYCLKSHASSGQIFVNIQNGYEINELHNVLISSPSNGQSLVYESSTGLWKNQTVSAVGLPSQTGNSGKYLTTDGSDASWADITVIPSQANNSGKILTTNGTSASWQTGKVKLGYASYNDLKAALSTYNDMISVGAYLLIRDYQERIVTFN